VNGEAPLTRILSLDDAVQTALRANPNLEDAEAAIRRAEAVVSEARALRMPRLDTDTRFQVQGPIPVFTTVTPATTPGGAPTTTSIPFGKTFTKTFNVIGSYNVDPFGVLRDNKHIAQRQVEVVRASLFQTQNDLVFSVQNVYLSALRAKELIGVSTEAIAAAQEQLRVAEAQFRAGVAPEFDVLRASVQVSNNRQNLVAAQATYRRALVGLAQLLSLEANTRLDLIPLSLPPEPEAVAMATAREALAPDASAPAPAGTPESATSAVPPTPGTPPLVSTPAALNAVPRTLEGALGEAFRTRPEVYGAEWARRVAQARLSQERKGNYPELNLSASFNFQPDQVGLAAETKTWSILANITLPLWDGGITRARVRQARADISSAQARIDAARDRVTEEVRTSLVDLEEATERRRAATANTTQAREALRIAQVRYTAGLAPNVEVTDAQVALTQARSNEVNAAYDYLASLANLNRGLGRYADNTLRRTATSVRSGGATTPTP
jgi:outer membrane protein TolC